MVGGEDAGSSAIDRGEGARVFVCVRGFSRGWGKGRIFVYVFAVSPMVGGEDASVCMPSWLPTWVGERTHVRVCVRVRGFPRGGGRGRKCSILYVFLSPPAVWGIGRMYVCMG